MGQRYYFGNRVAKHRAEYVKPHASQNYYTTHQSGWVQFSRLDTAVAAGTFEFTAYRTSENDSVVITEGRFDIGRG
jgi:hypothetical protein